MPANGRAGEAVRPWTGTDAGRRRAMEVIRPWALARAGLGPGRRELGRLARVGRRRGHGRRAVRAHAQGPIVARAVTQVPSSQPQENSEAVQGRRVAAESTQSAQAVKARRARPKRRSWAMGGQDPATRSHTASHPCESPVLSERGPRTAGRSTTSAAAMSSGANSHALTKDRGNHHVEWCRDRVEHHDKGCQYPFISHLASRAGSEGSAVSSRPDDNADRPAFRYRHPADTRDAACHGSG